MLKDMPLNQALSAGQRLKFWMDLQWRFNPGAIATMENVDILDENSWAEVIEGVRAHKGQLLLQVSTASREGATLVIEDGVVVGGEGAVVA